MLLVSSVCSAFINLKEKKIAKYHSSYSNIIIWSTLNYWKFWAIIFLRCSVVLCCYFNLISLCLPGSIYCYKSKYLCGVSCEKKISVWSYGIFWLIFKFYVKSNLATDQLIIFLKFLFTIYTSLFINLSLLKSHWLYI